MAHSPDAARVRGALRQVYVSRVKSSLKLLFFGGELVGEGFDFIALLDRLLLLLLGGNGVGDGFLLVGVGLRLGCGCSHSLPGADGSAKNQAGGNGGSGGEGGFVLAGEFLKAVHGSWGTGEDGFVGKVTLDISREAAGRFVAA